MTGPQTLKAIVKGEQPRDMSPSEQLQALKSQIDGMQTELQRVLGPRVSAAAFVGAAWAAVLHNPKLVEADRRTFFAALRKAAGDGLVPDGREAVLNVYNTKVKESGGNFRWVKKVEYLPMVGGLVKKLYESGEITYLDAAVVYQKDTFRFRRGDAASLEHEPYLGAEDPGPIIAAYCVVKLKNGEIKREVMPWRDIEKVRAASKSGEDDKGPWVTWPDQMAIKSVIKRISKQVPKSPELERLIAMDDALEYGATDAAAQAATGGAPALNFNPSQSMADIVGAGVGAAADADPVDRGDPDAPAPRQAPAAKREAQDIDEAQDAGLRAAEGSQRGLLEGTGDAAAPEGDIRPEPPPFTFAVFVDKARAARTLEDVDDLASLITAYPRNQQPELSEEIGRTRKRIAGAAKK